MAGGRKLSEGDILLIRYMAEHVKSVPPYYLSVYFDVNHALIYRIISKRIHLSEEKMLENNLYLFNDPYFKGRVLDVIKGFSEYDKNKDYRGPKKRLDKKQVFEILVKMKKGEKVTKLAPEYDVSIVTLYLLRRGRIYKDLFEKFKDKENRVDDDNFTREKFKDKENKVSDDSTGEDFVTLGIK